MIYVIDDDEIMCDCIVRACGNEAEVRRFGNAIEAMQALDKEVPSLIFLDILLDGPDGFTFLNELLSYTDTAKIPIVIVSSIDFSGRDLTEYGVVGVLDKTKMLPKEISEYAKNMPNKDIRTLGIVLRRTNYGEADRILNILTPSGKITAIAKGVRKSRSKLAGGIEMFSVIDFNIHTGRGEMGVVTSARMLRYYDEILKDFSRMETLGMILKKVGRAAESSDNPEYYKIVEECMDGLNDGFDVALVEEWFLLNLAKAMGEEVNLYRDVGGEKLMEDSRYNWDITSDAFVYSENGEFGANEIKMLRLLMTTDLKTIKRIKVPAEMYGVLLDLVRVATHV